MTDPLTRMSARGRERFEQLCREVAQGNADCERCFENGSKWDDGTKGEHYGDIVRKVLGGVAPFEIRATCVVWQRDRRLMVDLSHCEASCDYHVRYRPYSGDPRYIEREVIWRSEDETMEALDA